MQCGYDLAGLSGEGVCPECGRSIAESVAHAGVAGRVGVWLGRMRVGVLVVGAALGVMGAAVLWGMARWGWGDVDVAAVLVGLAVVAWACGWWLIGTEPPVSLRAETGAPWAVRAGSWMLVTAVVLFAGAVGLMSLGLQAPALMMGMVAVLAGIGGAPVVWICGFTVIAEFGRWSGDRWLTVGGYAACVMPLLAAVAGLVVANLGGGAVRMVVLSAAAVVVAVLGRMWWRAGRKWQMANGK